MKIVYFGSAEFGLPSLKALIEKKYEVCCVVTQPDKQKGRGMHIAQTPIKDFALSESLKIYQPEKINTPEAIEFLSALKPDLFIVIAYGQILSKQILDIPAIMSINTHASILPEYRGAAPINWAIIDGKTQTGNTIIKMSPKMDAGPIILQSKINIKSEDNAITLENKLSLNASELLLKTLESIKDSSFRLSDQSETEVTLAYKMKKNDGLINWNKTAEDIHNLIRGCLGWPDAFTHFQGKLLKIFKTSPVMDISQVGAHPGEIIQVHKNNILVATGKGSLLIEELQIEGKKRMEAGEFIAGHKIKPGEILS